MYEFKKHEFTRATLHSDSEQVSLRMWDLSSVNNSNYKNLTRQSRYGCETSPPLTTVIIKISQDSLVTDVRPLLR
jgi:hypothetical protein